MRHAEEILVAAARAGADERALARICAEIRDRTAPPDIHFAELCQMDQNSALQDTWIAAYRAQWAAHRAAARCMRRAAACCWRTGRRNAPCPDERTCHWPEIC